MNSFDKLIDLLKAIDADFKVINQDNGKREALIPIVGVNPCLKEDDDFPVADTIYKIYEKYDNLEENFDTCLHILEDGDNSFSWSAVWNEECE